MPGRFCGRHGNDIKNDVTSVLGVHVLRAHSGRTQLFADVKGRSKHDGHLFGSCDLATKKSDGEHICPNLDDFS